MAVDHHAVRRGNLVGINHEGVTHRDVLECDIHQFCRTLPVGNRRHPFGERSQHRRGAPQRVALQGFPAGEHQHDDRASQILTQHDRRDDGNAAEQIGTKLPFQELPQQVIEKRQAADSESRQQRNLIGGRRSSKAEAERQMEKDGGDGNRRDDRGLAIPEAGRRIPGPAGRQPLTQRGALLVRMTFNAPSVAAFPKVSS